MRLLKVEVIVSGGKVTLVLSKRVDWLSVSPAEARELARELLKRAEEAERKHERSY